MKELLLLILGIFAAGMGALALSSIAERTWRRRREMQMDRHSWETFQRRVGGKS